MPTEHQQARLVRTILSQSEQNFREAVALMDVSDQVKGELRALGSALHAMARVLADEGIVGRE